MAGLMSKLSSVQFELRAPKSQYNSFGKYNYRNTEDILEALKPLLSKYRLCLLIKDEIMPIMDRIYVVATVLLYDIESSSSLSTQAWAREEENKKGMDGSQVTGASSSYARKYALNGMFLIDDSKDSDYTNGVEEQTEKPARPKAPQASGNGGAPSIMDNAVDYIKKSSNKQQAYDQIISKYGFSLTQAQTAALLKFVR
jgi:hypothetical protein